MENELKGSRMKVDTASEGVERRTAATWCGSKGADWRMAAVKTFASMAGMASMAWMASMDSKAPMVSMVAVTAQNWRNLNRETVLNALEVVADTRWNTNGGKIAVVYEQGQSSPENWRCSLTKLARAAGWIQKLETGGQNW